MLPFRFHVVALPHTQTHKRHDACAFTAKVRKFVQMMVSLGHEVYHYGAEGSEVECAEDVTIISAKEQEAFFGPHDPNALYSLDWTGAAPYWKLTNDRAAAEINKRKRQGDFVCVIMGRMNLPLAQQLGNDVMVVEYGIGYTGTFAKYRVFESYSLMHRLWGAEGGYDPDGRFTDTVICNSFNPDDIPFQAKKGDYFLYLGRLVKRKGIQIAVATCKRLGAKLIVAGQGCKSVEGNKIIATDGEVYEGDLEYVGCVTGQRKAELLGGAKALFAPTIYVEPFGGVVVEAMLAGTPGITTDFGAFSETVEHGKTGFRCRTLNEFVQAAKHIQTLDPQYIHDRAVALYSMNAVRWRYDTYFRQLQDLWDDGWYAVHDRPDDRWLKDYR